ncbi:MAG: hypothetical protein H7281_01350 [Bacteriovorax sp.]|nr:hypothetical protein [Bacteriovorax sp.]
MKANQLKIYAIYEKLINENIPKESLVAIGRAFKGFDGNDIKEIGSTLLDKDLIPAFKDLKVKASSLKIFFQNFNKTPKLIYKDIYHDTKILIPETKKRITDFLDNISRDYSLLESDEERGKYILKLIAYSSIFILAFQAGAEFPYPSIQRNYLTKSLLPVLMINGSLLVMNRLLEQVEKKITDNSNALSVTSEIRNFINVINQGFSSGMTLQMVADGVAKTSINPKNKLDRLVHSTVLGLFSKNGDKSDS